MSQRVFSSSARTNDAARRDVGSKYRLFLVVTKFVTKSRRFQMMLVIFSACFQRESMQFNKLRETETLTSRCSTLCTFALFGRKKIGAARGSFQIMRTFFSALTIFLELIGN